MQRLLLMRHAHSPWSGQGSDYARILDERGHRDALRMGALIRDRGWMPDRILGSPATRAASTAIDVASAWGAGADAIRFERRLYDHGLPPMSPQEGTLLVVGHNPHVASAVVALADGAPDAPPDGAVTPGTVAAFEAVRGAWRLAWWQTPDGA